MPTQLHVIVGPMFSGKSGRLLWFTDHAKHGHKRIRIIKPRRDTRTNGAIASRKVKGRGNRITGMLPATAIGNRREFDRIVRPRDFDVLIVDEAHLFPLDRPVRDCLGWFGRAIRELILDERFGDIEIVIAGLDLTWDAKPFSCIPGLLALATSFEKLTAVCMFRECHKEAQYSQRMVAGNAQVQVGDIRQYEARCKEHFGLVDTLRVGA